MAQTAVVIALFLLCPLASSWGQSSRTSAPSSQFVIDENRPYVYLRFDHMGTGVRFSDDEPPNRVWFRFVNNCDVGIVLRTFGAPDGSLKDEVGVIHYVEKDEAILEVTSGIGNRPPAPNEKGSKSRETAKMPMGYDAELSSVHHVSPGNSLLFSIPVTHLSESWHIEIPYKFDVPIGKGPRQPIVGGEPKMVLLYSVWNLPEAVQQQLLRVR
jgi:hypothetical protein